MFKKSLAWLLVACMVLSMIPMTVFAAEDSGTESTATVNGIVYSVDNGNAQVTDGKSAVGDIVVPEKVTIGGTEYPVTSIAANAFNDANEVTSVVVPNSVTSLGGAAFANMDKLKSITIGNGVTLWGSKLAVNNYELETVVIAEGATLIGDLAFRTCPKLANLTLPSTLKQIGATAFAYSAITELDIPASVESIGADAFKDIDTLKKVTFNSVPASLGTTVFQMCDGLEEVVLPEGLKSIPQGTFRYCTSLKTINFPESLTEIGNYSFQGCTSLESVTISKNIANLVTNAFNGCTSLKNLTIEEGFAGTIGGYVFQGCTALESVVIPSSMETVGESMFNMCSNLKSVTLSEGVKTLNISAFANCSSLTSITLPDSLERIRHGSFANCTALESIIIVGDNIPVIEHSNALDGLSEDIAIFYTGNDEFTGNWASVADNVVKADANSVAIVDKTGYATLKEAITKANAVEGGATVTLIKDVTLGEKLTISGNVTIAGAYTITRADTYTGTFFAVNSGATLTLDGGLVIDGGNNYEFDRAAFDADAADWNKSIAKEDSAKWFTPEEGAPVATAFMITTTGGTVNLNNVTVQNNYSVGSGVVSAGANSTINLTGAKITHIAATQNSGIAVNASGAGIKVNMNEGTVIDGNHVGGNHGIFKIYSGTVFTMNGGEITNNTGWNSNGVAVGVYWATFNMKGGKICSNVGVYGPSNGRNAAIYLHSGHTFEMTGGTVCHNSGRGRGGIDAPYDNGTAKISGGEVLDNISRSGGSSYDVLGTASMEITGGTFTQDVSKWLAPDTGLVYDEATGTYGITDHVYNLWFRDPVTGEQLPYVGPLKGNDPASLVATGKAFYDDYYVMELEVLSNAKIDDPIVIDYPMTVNLGGYTLTGVDVYPVIRVQGGAEVTVKNGTINNDDYVFVVGASDGSSAGDLTIESGKYHGDTTVASVTKGTLTVNGGEFSVDPYEGSYGYTLNCVDANYKDDSAAIVVNGGKFYKFNPADNAAEGAGTSFVTEAYLAEADGDYYTVRQNKDKLETVADIVITLNNGQTVTLKYPSERFSSIQHIIGTNDYADFVLGADQNEMLASVANGDVESIVMNLYSDIELDAPINFYNKYFQVPVEYAITVNGKGNTVTWADGYTGTLFNIESGVTVEMKNLTIDGENAFTFYDDTTTVENGQNWYTRFVDVGEEDKAVNANVIVNAGNLTLNGTTIQNVTIASDSGNGKTENSASGGFYLMYNDDLALIKSNGGKVTLDGANITGNAGLVLNAIKTETALNNAIIDGNMGCGNKGGIIIANGGTMEITGTSIDDNKAMARSATILGVINGAEVTFGAGSTMDRNKHIGVGSNTAGAMIVLEGASQFVMNGGSISDNVGGRAGAIASRWVGGNYGQHAETSIILNAGEIKGNTADTANGWNGASVFLRSPAVIGEGMTIEGTIAVNANPGALAITGGNFTDFDLVVTDGLKAEISGGTFDKDPNEWCAKGYAPVDNGDGTWKVTENKIFKLHIVDPVTGEPAFIPYIEGNDLKTVVETGKSFYADYYNMTLEILGDWELDETVTIDYPMTINLNENTITTAATADGDYVDAFTILAAVTVTGNGTVDARSSHGYTFYVGDKNGNAGNLTIENGTFYGETSVVNNRLGSVVINGGNFEATEYNGAHEFTLNCIDANYNADTANIVVNGGKFYKFNPADNAAEGTGTSFVTDAYTAEADGDYYTVRALNYVAEVNGVKYESLQEAINACKNGETVKIIADINYSNDDIVDAIGGATGFGNYPNPSIIYTGGTKGATDAENKPSEVNAVIDLNGHTITSTADAYLFLIMDNTKLTFTDSVGNGKVIANADAPALWVVGTETLVTIEKGLFQTDSATGVIHVTHGGDLVITGGEFKTTAADASLLIMLNTKDRQNSKYFIKGVATVTISGGTFHGFDPRKVGDDNGASSIEDIKFVDGCAENFISIYNEEKGTYGVDNYIEIIKAELLAGHNVKLEKDIVVDGSMIESIPAPTNGNGKYPNYGIFNIVGDYDVTFDLNGHSITYNGHKDFQWNGKTYNSCTVAHGLFYANAGADFTVIDSSDDKSGTVTVYGLASGAYVASPDTTFTIEGGTWKNVGCATCGGTNIFLYPLQGGELYIKDGYFDQALDGAGESYLIVEHGGAYANSVIDYSKTKVEISGGTFVGMNPEELKYFNQTADNKLDTTTEPTTDGCADGYAPEDNGDGTYSVKVELPEVVITDIKGDLAGTDPDLTFALNFAIKDIDKLSEDYLEDLMSAYGSHYVDYVLTIEGLADADVTFNANGDADGYLAGQYDAWSANWVSVPFEDVTIENGESLYIMEYAAKLMGQSGLRFTLAEVAAIVQNFDCGVYFTPEFLAKNPDLKVTLQLKVFTEDADGNKIENIDVAKNVFTIENITAIVSGANKQSQYFATFADAYAAAEAGDTIELLAPVVITADTTLDFTDITVDGNGVYPAFRIQNGANVTVKGGEVTNSDYVFVLGASDGSSEGNLTIQSGKFHGDTTVASVTKGTLTVNGGEFSVDPYEGSYDYLLNCIDANYKDGSASIVVKGGTFTGFNPADNAAENPKANFVADGYVSVENTDGSWAVVEKTSVTIGSVEDLLAFGAAVTGNTKYQGVKVAANPEITVVLTADLDLAGSGFAPIGNGSANAFSGTFDGQNHTISNMTLSCDYYRGVGFFRSLGKGATVKNVTFVNANVNNGNATGGNHFYGVVAGFSYNLTLDNVDIKDSTVTCKYAGAITVGCVEGATVVKNCDVENVVLSTTSIRGSVFGILGNSANGHTIATENNTVNNAIFVVDGEVKELKETLNYNEWATGTDYTEYNYVAQIGDTKYTSLFDAVAAAADGDTITLIGNVVRASTLVVDKNVTIDLNGKTVSAAATVNGAPVIRVLADVTVKNGKVDGRDGASCYAFIVGNAETAGKLTIVDGNYYGDVTVASVTKGELNVQGGYFEATEYNGAHEFTLNCIDKNYKDGIAKISVSGGTFYKFNPADNAAENPKANFVADGYVSVENTDGYWTVEFKPVAKIGDTTYPTLAAAIAAAKDGDTIVLIENIELADEVVTVNVSGKITLDLNGHTVTGTFTEKTTAFIYVTGCELTILDSTESAEGGIHAVNTNGNLSNLIRVEADAKMVITNGNFTQDASTNGSGMIDSRGDEIITVNGGNFRLYNIGAVSNGSPWIFNASSQNEKNIVVNGGTFNADIIHQYYPFEVMAPREKALVEGTDGIWYFVDAVAYVNEQEWSSRWYTNEVGYATLEAALEACEDVRTKSGQTSAEEFVSIIDTLTINDTVANVKNRKITGNVVLGNANATLTAPKNDALTVTSGVSGYDVVYENGAYKLVKLAVAKIGDTTYPTLAAAIEAAKSGDTITFIANITEDVTIDENLTIDGADFKYTGTMTGNSGLTVTVQKVNFVNGGFDKSTKSAKGKYTFKDCSFDGDNSYNYPLRFKGADTVIVENCTVADYRYSFLYITSATNTVSVKDVTVENCPNYAIYFASGVTNATIEGLKVKNSDRGFLINNTANRTFTIIDCTMENVVTAISHSNGDKSITCNALGNNDFGTAAISEYANIVLAAENATLKAIADLNVTTNVAGSVVEYENGTYYVAAALVKNETTDKYYASLAAAIEEAKDGDTIVVLEDINLSETATVLLDNSYDTYFLVEGKTITIDLNGKTLSGEYAGNGMLVGVFSTDNKGNLTITGNGTVNLTATSTVYSLIANYEELCSITVENGTFKLDAAKDSLIYSGATADKDKNEGGITINGGDFYLGNTGTGANASPWIFNVLGQNHGYTAVNGGTFNTDVNHQFWANEVFVPETLALQNNGDGTWTVVDAVAYIEEIATSRNSYSRNVGYATFAEAHAAAKTGATITLVADLTSGVTVDKDVEIDTNGKSVAGIVLANVDATVLGVEGLNVTTSVAGYEVAYADGTYSVVEAEKVAQIGNVTYSSLADAVAAAKNGDTIVVLKDTTANGVTIGYSTAVEITIDLNGHKVSSTDKVLNVFRINTVVTLTNGTVSGNSTGGTVNVTYNGKLILGDNITITSGGQANAINLNTGTLEVAQDATNVVVNGGIGSIQTQGDTVNTITIGAGYYKGDLVINDASTCTLTGGTFTMDVNAYCADGYYAKNNGDGTWTVVKLFNIAGANMNLGNSLDMNFFIKKSDIIEGREYYLTITKTYADGRDDLVITVPQSEWKDATKQNMYYVTFEGLAAKEMSDIISVQVFDASTNDIVSTLWVDSVRLYAERMLPKATSDEEKTLYVDMLNYGAGAQAFYKYNNVEANLANANIADYQSYATVYVEGDYTNNQIKGNDYYIGTSLVLKNTLVVAFAFSDEAITDGSYAIVNYTDHRGKAVELKIDASEFVTQTSVSGVKFVYVDSPRVADGRQLISCTIYDAEGNIISSASDNVESYVARNAAKKPFYELILKFSDAAHAYLHRNDK